MQELKNIQALRGVAALSVVAFHLVPIEAKYGAGDSILPDFFKFGMFGVDLFFVISGFVMVLITRGQFRKPAYALDFLYRRVTRIYPPYWLYTILVLVVFLIKPAWVNSAQDNQVSIVSSFLLWPEATLPLINVAWTLIHEMYFYFVFFLLLLLVSERFLGLALAVWAVAVVSINYFITTKSPVLSTISHPLTLEFVAGCFLAVTFRKDNGWKITFLLVCISVVAISFSISNAWLDFPSEWMRVMYYGVPATTIVYCLVMAEREGFVLNRYLVQLGDASYSIYLLHLLVLSAVGRALYSFSSTYPMSNAALVVILAFCVVVSGIVGYQVVERPLLQATRSWIR